jgi:hypothetical protein
VAGSSITTASEVYSTSTPGPRDRVDGELFTTYVAGRVAACRQAPGERRTGRLERAVGRPAPRWPGATPSRQPTSRARRAAARWRAASAAGLERCDERQIDALATVVSSFMAGLGIKRGVAHAVVTLGPEPIARPSPEAGAQADLRSFPWRWIGRRPGRRRVVLPPASRVRRLGAR